MNDQAGKLFAGHMGVCAVLVDVLIDKGIISQSEFFARFRRAHVAASQCSGGPMAARALADIVEYLEPAAKEQSTAGPDHTTLNGQTILVVEEQPLIARDLQVALENAGAEVLVARDAADALSRLAQFDFSAAVLDWRPDTSEYRTVTRWLREDGVRFLFYAARPPADVLTECREPILLKPAPPEKIVKALAQLIGPSSVERVRALEPSSS